MYILYLILMYTDVQYNHKCVQFFETTHACTINMFRSTNNTLVKVYKPWTFTNKNVQSCTIHLLNQTY